MNAACAVSSSLSSFSCSTSSFFFCFLEGLADGLAEGVTFLRSLVPDFFALLLVEAVAADRFRLGFGTVLLAMAKIRYANTRTPG